MDQFIQHEISSSAAREVQEETDVYESQEPHTQALQKLIGSAKTLTAKQDLVNTLRYLFIKIVFFNVSYYTGLFALN